MNRTRTKYIGISISGGNLLIGEIQWGKFKYYRQKISDLPTTLADDGEKIFTVFHQLRKNVQADALKVKAVVALPHYTLAEEIYSLKKVMARAGIDILALISNHSAAANQLNGETPAMGQWNIGIVEPWGVEIETFEMQSHQTLVSVNKRIVDIDSIKVDDFAFYYACNNEKRNKRIDFCRGAALLADAYHSITN
jgi:uncharacterized protein (DUF302 family)